MSKPTPEPRQGGGAVLESLRQSEERFRLLVDNVRDYAIFMLDPQGHVLTWNQGGADGNRRACRVCQNHARPDRAAACAGARGVEPPHQRVLAMLAHELRNPLAPIRNAVSVMQLTNAHDTTVTWARDVIDRQATHMTRLVDDLLDISRITSGKITLRSHPVDVNEVALRAVEVARPLIDARHHELTLQTHDGPLIVEGDTTRLAQVVVNLLNNAAKYTPERGKISLTVTRDEHDALIAVRDNGPGLTPALLAKVFDLFAPGERSLARSEGGLGVGLTLARRITEMHGGTVTASSEGPNCGAEFVVRVPLAARVARRIRDLPELASTMLVAMTGYGQEEDRRRSAQSGFAHHLVKPIDPEALKRVIASAGCDR